MSLLLCTLHLCLLSSSWRPNLVLALGAMRKTRNSLVTFALTAALTVETFNSLACCGKILWCIGQIKYYNISTLILSLAVDTVLLCWTLVDALMETLCRDTPRPWLNEILQSHLVAPYCWCSHCVNIHCHWCLDRMKYYTNGVTRCWCWWRCVNMLHSIMYPCLCQCSWHGDHICARRLHFFGLDKSSCSYLGVMVWLHCIGCIASRDSKLRLTVRLAHPPDRKLVPFRASDRLCCHHIYCSAITVPCCLIYIAL